MVKPNFLLVGAPKCGTTSMNYYLKQHPEIFLSECKEPNFFAKDTIMPHSSFKNNEKKYYKLFENVTNEKIIGEASTMYFYSDVAYKEIKKSLGNIKILIMIRNPIDLMHSQHNQKVYEGIEGEPNFEKALNLEEPRKTEPIKMNIKSVSPKMVSYKHIANYPKHIKKFINLFGRKNVKIVILEEFHKDTQRIYSEILEFLGLEYSSEIDFSIKWESRRDRFNFIKKYQKILFANFSLKTKKILRPIYPRRLINYINEINTIVEKREELPNGTRRRIYEEIKYQIKDLEKILNKDLSLWEEDEKDL